MSYIILLWSMLLCRSYFLYLTDNMSWRLMLKHICHCCFNLWPMRVIYGVWQQPRPYTSALLGRWSWIPRSLVVWGCWLCFPSLFSRVLYWLNPVGVPARGFLLPSLRIFLFSLMKWYTALLCSSRKKTHLIPYYVPFWGGDILGCFNWRT